MSGNGKPRKYFLPGGRAGWGAGGAIGGRGAAAGWGGFCKARTRRGLFLIKGQCLWI